MHSITTLGKIFDRVDELSKNCTDEFVTVKDISFNNLESMKILCDSHQLRPIAQQSICFRLGIPIQYMRRCPSDLQAQNLNHWIKHERNEQLFVRFDGDDVRAIFTPKYKPVDNFEVLEKLDSMGYPSETEVQCHLDKEFMQLSIPDGKKSFSINGDNMIPGISISNSEVGLSSLSISAFILRLVCTNGLVSKTEVSASYRHISTKILSEFPEVIEKVSFELGKQRNQLKLSLNSPVDDPLLTLESFNRQFQLDKEQREAVDWAWPQESGNTMFNVINTYTRAAQYEGLPSAKSYRLQKVGGEILGLLK